MEIRDQIKSLKELQEMGAISQEEFDEQKHRILDHHFDGGILETSNTCGGQEPFCSTPQTTIPLQIQRLKKAR